MKHWRPIRSLIPFLVFLVLYIGIGVTLTLSGDDRAFYQFPAPACALIGFFVAVMLGIRQVDTRVRTFAKGIAEETIILMCLIFLLAGAFSAICKASGGADATVQLGLELIPSNLMVPGIFVISCLISLAMGTSMGTISTLAPIGIGIATETGIPLPLIIGTIVGGSMFGDNLSVISDTTVAATSTQGCSMKDKMRANLPVALISALLVLVALAIFSPATTNEIVASAPVHFYKTLPYLVVLGLALSGLNVIAVLMFGIALSALIGYQDGSLTFVGIGQTIYQGFQDMSEVFFLSVLAAGLAAIAAEEGGILYLLNLLKRFIRSRRSAEAGIAMITSIANLSVANNTVAILISGKLAKRIATEFHIPKARAASLLDTFSCIVQGLIPYGAQLLVAGGMSYLSPFSIIPYIWYPMVLLVVTSFSILLSRNTP